MTLGQQWLIEEWSEECGKHPVSNINSVTRKKTHIYISHPWQLPILMGIRVNAALSIVPYYKENSEDQTEPGSK